MRPQGILVRGLKTYYCEALRDSGPQETVVRTDACSFERERLVVCDERDAARTLPMAVAHEVEDAQVARPV